MGQKVNPISFRMSVNNNWFSNWYAGEGKYQSYLVEDLKIRNYFKSKRAEFGISTIVIERPSGKPQVIINTSKPSFVIGKKGKDLDSVKKDLLNLIGREVSISVKDVKRPDIDANIVSQNIVTQLEKRLPYRKIVKKVMENVMKLGVKGIKISCAGRLNGIEIARTETFKEGSVSLHTIRANIDYALAEAHTTYGVIGIKVWIYKKSAK